MVGEEHGILGVNCPEEKGTVKDSSVPTAGELMGGNTAHVMLGSHNH